MLSAKRKGYIWMRSYEDKQKCSFAWAGTHVKEIEGVVRDTKNGRVQGNGLRWREGSWTQDFRHDHLDHILEFLKNVACHVNSPVYIWLTREAREKYRLLSPITDTLSPCLEAKPSTLYFEKLLQCIVYILEFDACFSWTMHAWPQCACLNGLANGGWGY